MSIEIHDERIEVRDKRRLMVQLEPEALEVLGSPHHLAMYFTLARLAGNESRTAPGLRALAAQASMGHTRASEVINDLIESGIISRTRIKLANGQDGASVYHLHGLGNPPADSGVRGADTTIRPADTSVRHTEGVRHTDTEISREIRHTDTAVRPADTLLLLSITEEQQATLAALVATGVTKAVAMELVSAHPEECARQLAYLPGRTGSRDRAAVLVKAIREAWTAPTGSASQIAEEVPAAGQLAFPRMSPGQEADRHRSAAIVASLLPLVPEPQVICNVCRGIGFVEAAGGANVMAPCPSCKTR